MATRESSALAAERAALERERRELVPGIDFSDGVVPGDRIPRIAGTGLEVFEIIKSYALLDHQFSQLQEAFDWLSADQLRAALRYYTLFTDEVEGRLSEESMITQEWLDLNNPWMNPANSLER